MSTVTTNFRLPKELLKALKRRALEEDKSASALVRELIEGYLGLDRTGERDRARSQRAAIASWMGTSLGRGFSGEDHDAVLYGRRRP